MGWSNRPTGLTHYEPPHTYRGYTLFSPNGGDDAYLVDMAGNFVHRWHCDRGINYGFPGIMWIPQLVENRRPLVTCN